MEQKIKCQNFHQLPDHLTLTHLKHQLTAPIHDHPKPIITITDEGYTVIDPPEITYEQYAICQGLDPSNPLTVIRATNTVECERVLNDLETIKPEQEHLTEHLAHLREEHTTAKTEYRTNTKDGIFPLETNTKQKQPIPHHLRTLRRKLQMRAIQYFGLGTVSLIEGSSFFPVLLSQYGIDPSNLTSAIATSFPMVILSSLFTLTISLSLFFLGKEVISRVHHFTHTVRTGTRPERLISAAAMGIWCTLYTLFITALTTLRSSFSQDILAMNEQGPADQALGFMYFVITATIPLVCGVLANRIPPPDPTLITAKETWEKSNDEALQAKETNLHRKHQHEAYMELLHEEQKKVSQELNTLLARKNTLLDIAQKAEEKLRATFIQEKEATIRHARSLHLALHTAKLEYQKTSTEQEEITTKIDFTMRRQSSMARIIELAKAHS